MTPRQPLPGTPFFSSNALPVDVHRNGSQLRLPSLCQADNESALSASIVTLPGPDFALSPEATNLPDGIATNPDMHVQGLGSLQLRQLEAAYRADGASVAKDFYTSSPRSERTCDVATEPGVDLGDRPTESLLIPESP